MSYAPQSSPGPVRQPAFLLALWLCGAPLAAQAPEALAARAVLHREPGATPLVTIPAGAPVEAGRRRGAWREVTIDAWIYTPSTSPTRRDGFDLVVTEAGGENLRRTPNGPVVGRARSGTLLERVARQGNWTRVRRAGWVPGSALPTRPGAAAAAAEPPKASPAPKPPAEAPVASPPDPVGYAPARDRGTESFRTARETAIAGTPEGPALGTLQTGVPARVLGRAGEWTRVQIEGWVREADLEPGDDGALAGVTAAEVRSSPDRYVGRTLDWRLQIIAVQVADELRAEIPEGQPYLLTRGPLPEPGFVYVAIPPEQIEAFRALPPLQEVVLRVTIRAARTRYLTTPVAELVSVVSGMEGT